MTQHLRTPEQLDPQFGIGAARQAATPEAPSSVASERQPDPYWHYPRRMIGPDLIKALRDMLLSQTGNKESFDLCVVQTDREGNPMAEIDVNAMRLPKNRSEMTYDKLVGYAVSEAIELRERIDGMQHDMRPLFISQLLREAQINGTRAWTVSAECIRSLIFPNSYFEGRCDNVFYKANPEDGACGKVITLESLRPRHIQRFLSYARIMAPTVNPMTITPITNPHND